MNKYLRKFNLNNKTSIVIGGLGLIGLSAAYALAEAGSRVIIIDNYKKWKLLKKKSAVFRHVVIYILVGVLLFF